MDRRVQSPESIKILQLAKHFPPDLGGIETVTQSISEMLIAHGIQADVLCTAVREAYPEPDTPYQIIRTRPSLRFGSNKSVSLDYIRATHALSASYDAAIVHMPNPVAAAAVLAGWRKPVILLWHADIPQTLLRAVVAPLDRLLIRKASAIIGPTPVHLTASHLAAALTQKGVVIGFPFDRARLVRPTGTSAAAREARAFVGSRKLSLSIGRLVPYKGFGILIEAAQRFDEDLAAIIVGSGHLFDDLNAQIRATGVESRVKIMSSVSDAELADLLDLAHIGCMPSVTAAEMYGLAQVEAMAYGRPVVSTRLPRSGVPYVNRDGVTGLVVQPGNPVALANALNRLTTDAKLHRQLADGAAAAFTANHDVAPISYAYADLIRKLVAKAGRATLGSVDIQDSQASLDVIQAAGWNGGQHGWTERN